GVSRMLFARRMAVQALTVQGMADGGEMEPHLVRPPRARTGGYERGLVRRVEHLDFGDRRITIGPDRRKALPPLAPDPNRCIDRGVPRASVDDGQVGLATRREPF